MSAQDPKAWSEKVAALAIGRLLDNGMVKKGDTDKAIALAAEEIRVRLAMHDYPAENPAN